MHIDGVNLIPIERREARRRRARTRLWVGVGTTYGSLWMGAAVAAVVVFTTDNRSLRAELADVAREVDQSEVTTGGLRDDLVEAKAALEASRAVGTQPDWSVLLALLADSLGEDVVLRSCKLTPLGSRDGAGEVIKLEVGGLARSQQAVAQVILRLEETPLFRSVKLIDTRREPFRDAHAVAFRAECILDSEQEAGS
ncbi:MAG: PilN domain-containing protein [Planctomycetota bacterium]|jgi:Tfp pilus assembly protein PilN